MKSIITNTKVLVTGGAGFIGSNLIEELLKNNNQVVCLDNFSTGKKDNLKAFINNAHFTLIEGDIRNQEDCQTAVKGCKYVLHQAALGSVPRSLEDPATTVDVNIGGFVKMLFAAKQEGVKRFVYAASSSTYGDHQALPKQEHIIGNSLSPYGITKYVDELYAKNFSDIYGIETVGLRYFNVFGRKQDPDGAYAAVIPKFVASLVQYQSPIINGDGSYSRDFTYIDNVLQANQIAALTPTSILKDRLQSYNKKHSIAFNNESVLSEVFNVAFGQRTTLNELATILKENLSKFDTKIASVDFKYGPNRKGDIPHSLASIEKANTLLEYKPTISVKEGLETACYWYWENLKNLKK